MKVAMRLINCSFTSEDDGVIILLFGKTAEGQSVTVRVHGFDPYFYVEVPRGDRSDLDKKLKSGMVVSTEEVKLEIPGRGMSNCLRVVVNNPWSIADLRNKCRDVTDGIFGADIYFTHRFLYDMDMGASIEIEGEESPENVCGAYSTEVVMDAYCFDGVLSFKNVDPIYPPLTVLSFDIENSIEHRTIFCICGAVRVGKGPIQEFHIEGSEAHILQEFNETILLWDPDVITGYNIEGYDIPHIISRCKANKIESLPWGRDHTKARENRGFWKSVGRLVSDAWWFVKKEKAPKKETLNAVSQEFLNESKEDVDPKHIDAEWENNHEKVISYCYKDAELALRLLEYVRILDKGLDLGIVAKLPLDDTTNGRVTTWIDSLLIRHADRNKIAVPSNRYGNSGGGDDEDDGIEGGYVHDIKAGLYDMVIVFDFKSMYPSQIIQNNICVTTLDNENGTIDVPVEEINDKKTLQKPMDQWKRIVFVAAKKRKGLIPEILGRLGDDRERAKKSMKVAGTTELHDYFDRLQSAIKVLMNAFYGVTASSFYRFTNKDVGAAVTAFARHDNKLIAKMLTDDGYEVIYGDTDSIFILSPFPTDLEKTIALGKELAERFSSQGKVMEFEKILNPLFSHGKKKRYVGLKVWPPEKDANGVLKAPELLMRGYETRRKDSFDMQSELMTELFALLMEKKTSVVLAKAKQAVIDLQNARIPIEKLVFSKGVSDEADYKNPDSQIGVQITRKMKAMDYPVISGMKVAYIMTDSSKTPQEAEPFLPGRTFTHEPDWTYYARRMATSLSRITDYYGWSEDALLSGRKQCNLDKGWGGDQGVLL